MTGIIAESIYEFLDGDEVLPNEQKGCRRESRGHLRRITHTCDGSQRLQEEKY